MIMCVFFFYDVMVVFYNRSMIELIIDSSVRCSNNNI